VTWLEISIFIIVADNETKISYRAYRDVNIKRAASQQRRRIGNESRRQQWRNLKIEIMAEEKNISNILASTYEKK